MTLTVLKIKDGLTEKFTEMVCINTTDDPDQDWLEVWCYDHEDGTQYPITPHQIIDIQKYEV